MKLSWKHWGISLLRSSTTAPEALKILDQAEQVINFLLEINAEDMTTALRVNDYKEKELSRLKGKPAEITFRVARYTVGNA